VNENPWRKLPDKPPFVLPEDEDKVLAFNAKARQRGNQNRLLDLELIPEPFVGRLGARLILLGNNPGVKNSETAALRKEPAFQRRMRDNLLHQGSTEFPFLYLGLYPDIPSPSKEWWERRLKLILGEFRNGDVARSLLARNLLAVEFFPYVSHRYGHGKLSLPSQGYSFGLVRDAVKRKKAVIVLTRGERRWLRAVPALAGYHRLVRLKEVQRAVISPRNCRDDGWSHIREVVRKIEAMSP
jgi:hypothetical protein